MKTKNIDVERSDYELELDRAYELGLTVHEGYAFDSGLDGLIYDNDIYLSDRMDTDAKKKAVLGEEIEHFKRDTGNIVDQRDLKARKRERRTRKSAATKMVPVRRLLDTAIALKEYTNVFTLSQELEVPEELVCDAIDCYAKRYPNPVRYGSYLVRFNPFSIEKFKA